MFKRKSKMKKKNMEQEGKEREQEIGRAGETVRDARENESKVTI